MVLILAQSTGVIHTVAWILKVSMDVAVAISEGRRFHILTVLKYYIEVILEGFRM